MKKPNQHIFETTLLGTGGGYGESQVVHLGHGNWIVVDSCINPDTNKSLPLEYLNSIGVDISRDVKLIVCTHWHDDHIRGLSDLLEECKSAIFTMARASDRNKFLRLIGFDYRKSNIKSSISSSVELNICLDILKDREAVLKEAIEDRILLSISQNDFEAKVFSLSPSDLVMREFDTEISSLITEFGESNRKLIMNNPNSKCIVLYIKSNGINILLGADLEVDLKSNEKGWLRILDSSNAYDSKSSLYKVAHHGSENGDHERIWNELLIENPISKLTPWNRNSKLPQKAMLSRIENKSARSFITSSFYSLRPKPKKRDKDISKMIRTMRPTLQEVKYSFGQITCRTSLNYAHNIWSIEEFGESCEVNNDFIDRYLIE